MSSNSSKSDLIILSSFFAWLSITVIGLINATTLIAYVGDGSRFSKPKQLLNYAGLVPKLNQSGETDIHGKITKKDKTSVKKEEPFFGKVAVAVANHMLKTGLALLLKNDLYCTAKEDE